MSVKLTIKDEVNISFSNLPLEARRKLANTFKYELPYAKFHPAYRLGRWDGSVSLFGIGGNGYLNHLEQILGILDQMGITIDEVEDHRKQYDLNFEPVSETYWADKGVVWPKGHPAEGQPIMLRDYQVELINNMLKNPQSLALSATGSGKCLDGDTLLEVFIDTTTDFAKFVKETQHDTTSYANTISSLFSLVSKFTGHTFVNNEELEIQQLGINIDSPNGIVPVLAMIKKETLPMLKITLLTGEVLECARKHILVNHNNIDVYADQLECGDYIKTRNGYSAIDVIEELTDLKDCYDISVPAPYYYYDANGIVHHNTITTATLAHVCEQVGRTLTIVPNKSLVEQTAEDFVNVGLDVGMYYGDKKELDKQHTICTWQSLEVLNKKSKNGEAVTTLSEFLEGVRTVVVDECFDGNTLIQTPTGVRHIKDLLPGDKVINYCEETKEFKEDEIVKIYKNMEKSSGEKMLKLEFDSGDIVEVTANHKFLTNVGWVRADELTEDMEIISYNN